MAEAPDNPVAPDPHDEAGDPAPAPPPPAGWAQAWQVPALLVGLGLFILGVYVAMPEKKQDDFPGALGAVAQYLAAEDVDTAQQKLKAIEPHIERALPLDRARYEELWGDLVFTQQQMTRTEDAGNQEKMLRYYRAAAEVRALDDSRLQRMAEALVSLGREEEALGVLDKLRGSAGERRHPVFRRLVEKQLAQPKQDPTKTDTLLNRYLDEVAAEPDKAKRRAAEIWAYTAKMRLQYDAGNYPGVIDAIERRKITLMDKGGDKDLGPFDVLRAKSYLQTGNYKVAKTAFEEALKRLPQGDPLTADALVGLGQIELAQTDDIRAAWQRFKEAQESYRPASFDLSQPPYFDATIGRADCEARMGKHTEALEQLASAVKAVLESKRPDQGQRSRLIAVALSHHVASTDLEQYETALAYLSALTPLHGDTVPAEWWARFAQTHDRIANKMLRDAGLPLPSQGPAPGGGEVESPAGRTPAPTKEATRITRQDASRHFGRAGDSYAEHARLVKSIDPKAAGDSWLLAAAAYDNAFQWRQAVRMYQEFIDNGGEDPRRIDALHKLGMAFLADKKYKQAVEKFEFLKQHFPTHKITSTSLVPLSMALVAMEKLDEATKVLLEVVTNHPAITPESDEYRQALIALGRLYHQRKDFENAIQRLTIAVDRYGETADGWSLRFLLAESYRQSIPAIDKTLEEPLPQPKVREYQAERVRRLEQALMLHSQVVTQLGEMEEHALTPVQVLYFRNAYFYRADCAFDLKRFEQAIELYDAAARRWRDHPASLVALVQMVNAYAELGQYQNARAVNLRARDHLRRIPEEAFNDPSLPMTRKHWQDWLQWSSKLNLFDPQAKTATAD
jgi:tetratricopeptide (TPR) repeat protein